MTTTNTWPAAGYAALASSLEALSQGCHSLSPELSSGLQAKLRQLSAGMASSPAKGSVTTPAAKPLDLADALKLATAARGLALGLEGTAALPRHGEKSAPELARTLDAVKTQLGAALRRKLAHRVHGLYVIIDPQVTGGRDPLDIGKAAVQGGARMLQLRDKLRDKGQILPLAMSLQKLCQEHDVMLIINDHVDLAAVVGSEGVHVGQTDLPVAQVRQVLAPHQVLGRSNREIQLLVQSQEMGADHVAFGAIYTTTTKPGGRPPQGIELLKQARAVTKVPLVAIGGITAENVAPVVEAGADAICVTAAVGSAPDPEAAARRLVAAIRAAGGKA
ncbi:MAG: thiamine phosphate synthase [SAR202 cluster bacterium]|nr:thiamine phosphate synthase [SAR202 cluster bacterium]